MHLSTGNSTQKKQKMSTSISECKEKDADDNDTYQPVK